MKTTAAKAKKLIEPSLKDSELRYRRLFETAQDGILILDAGTGLIEDVNPYLIKMLGYSREELVKKKLWEVGAFKDIQASQEAFDTLQENEYIRYEDLPLKTKDGRMIEVEFVSNVYFVNDEKVIQCDIRDISEHRQIIAALQGNEKKYHDLINQSPDGYFIIELSGNILTVNKAICKELEFSEEEFLSMNIWDIVPEQYLDQYRQRLTKVLKGESLKEAAEYMVRGKHGKIHYVEVLSAPRYSGKNVIGFQGIARDITARKRAEEALRSSEDKYRTLVGHLPTVVYTNPVGDASSTLYVSPQIETLLGYTPQEWLADPKLWSKTLHPEDRRQVLKQAAQTDQSNRPFEMEYRMIARDGRLVWVHDQIVLVNDQEGKPQYWQGIMLDITERKQAEEALQASEEKYRMIVETSTEGMWVVDKEWKTTYVNPVMAEMLGYTADEILGRSPMEFVDREEIPNLSVMMKRRENGISEKTEVRMRRKDGNLMWAYGTSISILDDKGEFIGGLSLVADITERKLSAAALYESEERFKNAFWYSAIGMALVSLEGKWLKVNSSLSSILGYSEDELLTKTFQEITHPDDLDTDLTYLEQLLAGEISSYKMEKRYFHKGGKSIWVILAVALARDNGGAPLYFISQIEDITERKQAEEALRESEVRFRALIENSTDAITLLDAKGIAVYDSPASPGMLGYSLTEWIGEDVFALIHPDDLPEIRVLFENLTKTPGARVNCTFRVRHKSGSWLWIEMVATNLLAEPAVKAIVLNYRDITGQKQAEEQTRFQAALLNAVGQAVIATDTEGTVTYLNRAAENLYGWHAEEAKGRNILDVTVPQVSETQGAEIMTQLSQGESWSGEFLVQHRDGRVFPALVHDSPVFNNKDELIGVIGISSDITERRQAEDALHESEERFRAWIENSTDLVTVIGLDGLIQYGSPSYEHLLGYKPEELIGINGFDLVHPDDRDRLMGIFAQNIQNHGSAARAEFRVSHSDGSWRILEGMGKAYLDGRGQMTGLINARDITERKQAEKRMQRQLEHLAALSSIDRVVASITDIKLSLSEILAHVTAELDMDAAAVLLFNPHTQMLEYAAWRGFHSKAMRKAQVRLGESYAGRVALERQLIQIPNLKYEPAVTLLAGEGFVCYFGLPLIAKGQVKGVLEVFHRIPFEPDDEWFDFLHALAGQTAVAIENASLFESLQRSNTELTVAYDATIEGWSHALDLRDKETEGHTLRVTELTMKLARAFGLSDEELVHVRWGSLLHDIGKMGVPDGILLKPGELNEEEWAKMKEHPGFAYELLSPIRFLRQALDIPYCHHEKWDGTGYPRGLQGEQIPLVARIFAVVDVWDALNSDRPYRAAWPEDKAREHIRALSGTHFDPHVVDVFMQLPD